MQLNAGRDPLHQKLLQLLRATDVDRALKAYPAQRTILFQTYRQALLLCTLRKFRVFATPFQNGYAAYAHNF